MHIFGLILTIIIYFLLCASILLYLLSIFKKKYVFANFIAKIVFLYALIATAVESWALIIMNGGFHVYLKLGVDFGYTLIVIVPVAALLIASSIIMRKKMKSPSVLDQINGYFLPALTLIGFGAATIILFFNVGYFIFLNV